MPKRYEELTFTDDFMFCKVLEQDPELCRELTSLLLDRPVGTIVMLQGRKEVRQTLHRYTFTNLCHENQELELSDGATKIFVCAKGKDDTISVRMKNFFEIPDRSDRRR